MVSEQQAATALQSLWRGKIDRRKRGQLKDTGSDEEVEVMTAKTSKVVASWLDDAVEDTPGWFEEGTKQSQTEVMKSTNMHIPQQTLEANKLISEIQGHDVKMSPDADPIRVFFKQMYELAEADCHLNPLAYGLPVDHFPVGKLSLRWMPEIDYDDEPDSTPIVIAPPLEEKEVKKKPLERTPSEIDPPAEESKESEEARRAAIIIDGVITDPLKQLVGRSWSARLEIEAALDLEQICDHGHIQYLFCGEIFSTLLSTEPNSSPVFNYSYTHHVPVCSVRFVEYLMKEALCLELCLIQRLPVRDPTHPRAGERSIYERTHSPLTVAPSTTPLWYEHPGVSHFAKFCKKQLKEAKANPKGGAGSRAFASGASARLKPNEPMLKQELNVDWDGGATLLNEFKALCPVPCGVPIDPSAPIFEGSPTGSEGARAKSCLIPGDVTVYLANGETVVVHSFVVSLRSPVLRSQLSKTAGELRLDDYIYSGKVTLGKMASTIELFILAGQLQVVQLQAFCSRHVTSLRQLEFPQWRKRVKRTIDCNLGPAELQPLQHVALQSKPSPPTSPPTQRGDRPATQGGEGSLAVQIGLSSRERVAGAKMPTAGAVNKRPSAYEAKPRAPASVRREQSRKGRRHKEQASLESFYAPPHDEQVVQLETELAKMTREVERLRAGEGTLPRNLGTPGGVGGASRHHSGKTLKPTSASKMGMSQVHSVREAPMDRGALLDGVLATSSRHKLSTQNNPRRRHAELRAQAPQATGSLVAGIMTGERRQWTAQTERQEYRGSFTAR